MRFREIFFIFLLAELVSYAAYFFSMLNVVGFFVILATAIVLSLRRLEYGLLFVMADLILGGKSGALFAFEYNGFFLSLRMALFIIVMGVWGAKVIGEFRIKSAKFKMDFRQQWPMLKWWGVFGLAVVWGMVVGVMRGNDFSDLFLDANGYLYGAMVLPLVWVIRRMDANKSEWMRIAGVVFFAATTLLALKTLFAVYIFTHAGNNFIGANIFPFYRWVRETGVGEITALAGNFARVFFQSHVYNLLAFFGVLTFVILRSNATKDLARMGDSHIRARFFAPVRMTNWRNWALLILNTSVIIISLSRSFWVGVIAGLGVLGVVAWRTRNHNPSLPPLISDATVRSPTETSDLRAGGVLFFSTIVAAALIFMVARFPFPRPSVLDFGATAQARFQVEEAASSRWNLFPPLLKSALAHPVLGNGFGALITYTSNDPRIREFSPTGSYTTYAFEWGWLDIWMKLGILGLLAYGLLIFKIGYALYRTGKPACYLGGLTALTCLVAIHFFTPYLNHPLGIGALLLLTGVGMSCQSHSNMIR